MVSSAFWVLPSRFTTQLFGLIQLQKGQLGLDTAHNDPDGFIDLHHVRSRLFK
mgnify:FL=1